MKNKTFQALLIVAFVVLSVMIIVPFLFVISISLSNETDIGLYGYKLWPMQFDLTAYRYIFKNPAQILRAYGVTAQFSFVSTILGVFFMALAAYPLSSPKFRGKSALSFFLYFTMLFSGGLVPSYILITRYLHLDDTIWVYILPGLISPWYIFMIRTFFAGLPYDIVESAFLDGAGHYRIFFTMILPMSKPVIATVGLFVFLGKWNDWYTSMLYINKETLVSLQYMLQRIMQNIQLLQQSSMTTGGSLLEQMKIPSETVRMGMAVVVAGPALFVFLFFQKYFVQGLTIGSVKG